MLDLAMCLFQMSYLNMAYLIWSLVLFSVHFFALKPNCSIQMELQNRAAGN